MTGQSAPCGDHSCPATSLLRYWAVVAAAPFGQPFLGAVEKKPESQLDFAEHLGGFGIRTETQV